MRRPLLGMLVLVALAILLSWSLYRLLSARGASTAARLFPAEAAIYLEAPDVEAALAALRAAQPPGGGGPRGDHPLMRWLAARRAPGAAGVWAGAGGRPHWALALLEEGDARELGADLWSGAVPGALLEATYRGDHYTRLPSLEGLEMCAGRIGRYRVLASDESAYQRVLDVAAGGGSLDGAPGLARGRTHLEAGGFLFGYLAWPRPGAADARPPAGTAASGARRLAGAESVLGLAFQSRLGDLGWVDRFHLVIDSGHPPLALGILRRPPCAPDAGEAFPEDSTLLVSLCAGDLEDLYEEALEGVASLLRPEEAAALRERVTGLEQLTGLRIKRDLLRALGERFSAALAWDGEPGRLAALPGLLVSVEVERPREFQPVLERLAGFGRATGRLQREEVRDLEVFTILPSGRPGSAPETAGGESAPTYTLDGRRFLAAAAPARLRMALEALAAQRALARAEEVRALRRLAPAEVNLLVIVRPAALSGWLGRPAHGEGKPAAGPPAAGPPEGAPPIWRGAVLWAVGRRDGVHGEAHAPFSPVLGMVWPRLSREMGVAGGRSEASAEVGDDPVHVEPGLAEGRQPAVALHSLFPRVVGRERQDDVAAEAVEQGAEIARARLQVLPRIERVRDSQAPGGLRHELKEPLGAGP